MTDGTATGIITASALKSEMDRKREMERQRFEQKGADSTGRGAETVRLRALIFLGFSFFWFLTPHFSGTLRNRSRQFAWFGRGIWDSATP